MGVWRTDESRRLLEVDEGTARWSFCMKDEVELIEEREDLGAVRDSADSLGVASVASDSST